MLGTHPRIPTHPSTYGVPHHGKLLLFFFSFKFINNNIIIKLGGHVVDEFATAAPWARR